MGFLIFGFPQRTSSNGHSELNIIILSERNRFVEAESPTPINPSANDLSVELEKLGTTFKHLATNSKDLATVLRMDENFISASEKERQRRIIQNNLDAMMYSAPLLVNLSKLVVPIGSPDCHLRVME